MASELSSDERRAAQALDGLVGQFRSAFDCFRELVQNAIDAGSAEVSIWTEMVDGGIAVHVDDYGEGMNEEVIDGQLTRLFASSKEDDLTKIGKFGIGFVSIFALEPTAVLLQTGRGGEYWEVLFREDKTFSKRHLDTAVEGTQITLYLAGGRARYSEVVEQTHRALRRWCAHSETEITFEDRSDATAEPISVNAPLDVDGECPARVRLEGTEIALAYNAKPSYGFFNKGLTLLVTSDGATALGERAQRFRSISFKIKSRYLEHTLSRDTILKDQNYDKAITLLESAASGALREGLLGELEALASVPELGLADEQRYERLLGFLCDEPPAALVDLGDRALLRNLVGPPATLEAVRECAAREGRVFLTDRISGVTRDLGARGLPVVAGRAVASADTPGRDKARRLIFRYLVASERESLLGRVSERLGINLRADATAPTTWLRYRPEAAMEALLADPHDVFVAIQLDQTVPRELRELVEGAAALLDAVGARFDRLATCTLVAALDRPPLFLVGRELTTMMFLHRLLVPLGRVRLSSDSDLTDGEAAANPDTPPAAFLAAAPVSGPGITGQIGVPAAEQSVPSVVLLDERGRQVATVAAPVAGWVTAGNAANARAEVEAEVQRAMPSLVAQLTRRIADPATNAAARSRMEAVALDWAGELLEIAALPDGRVAAHTLDPTARTVLDLPLFSVGDRGRVSAWQLVREFCSFGVAAFEETHRNSFLPAALRHSGSVHLSWIRRHLDEARVTRLRGTLPPRAIGALPTATQGEMVLPCPQCGARLRRFAPPSGRRYPCTGCSTQVLFHPVLSKPELHLQYVLAHWIECLRPEASADRRPTGVVLVEPQQRAGHFRSIRLDEEALADLDQKPDGTEAWLYVNRRHPIASRCLEDRGAAALAWALLACYARLNEILEPVTNDHEQVFQRRVAEALLAGELRWVEPAA